MPQGVMAMMGAKKAGSSSSSSSSSSSNSNSAGSNSDSNSEAEASGDKTATAGEAGEQLRAEGSGGSASSGAHSDVEVPQPAGGGGKATQEATAAAAQALGGEVQRAEAESIAGKRPGTPNDKEDEGKEGAKAEAEAADSKEPRAAKTETQGEVEANAEDKAEDSDSDNSSSSSSSSSGPSRPAADAPEVLSAETAVMTTTTSPAAAPAAVVATSAPLPVTTTTTTTVTTTVLASIPAALPAAVLQNVSSGDVEAFLQTNVVDPEAAMRLRALSPHLQRRVLERGDLRHTRNPSAVLIARVRDAESGVLSQDGLGQQHHPQLFGDCHAGVEALISRYNLDARAAGVLRALPKHKQDIASQIDLTDARRPSAFIMAQLAQAKFLDDAVLFAGLLPGSLESQL
eukprot:CAMPEP_0179106256 /NCGR_PEP_ID=MMETSP0796-20121207/49396_1 /TAXON_ID=73915 /ORGANISM="Pyrodinium bahamense, Strain pbaha01" /LENGTH=400 /DNA_ID=CAMNT_0020804281 /DNA_START=34 /DNA_END=1234 /DNA_ORIENTATION=+